MAGWLDAAVRAFRREPSEEPESAAFRVVCACGRATAGTRRGEWQRAQCASCGEILFVLPKNVYPRPKVRRPPPPKPPEPAREFVPDGPPETVEDESIAGSTTHEEMAATRPSAPGRKSERSDRRAPAERPAPEKPAGFAIPARRRVFTRLRLLGAAICAVLVLTGWAVVRSQQRERADIAFRTGLPKIEEAMHDEDLLTAERELRAVVQAIDVLGKNDEEARVQRQLMKEVTALNDLASVSLFELAREAGQYLTRSEGEWARHFGTFAGRWIIVEAPLFRTRDAEGAEVIAVDVPLMAGEKPFRIVADLPAFEVLSLSEEPRPALFAAQLESCRMPLPDDPVVVLRLKPETGFLWHGEETWALAGLGEEDADRAAWLKKKLAEQRKLAGGAP